MKYQIKRYMPTKKELLWLLCLFFGIMLFVIIRNIVTHTDSVTTYTTDMQQRQKIITRVLVQQDDTLWKYASKYYSEEYEDVEELIFEIKKTNGLSDNLIKAGSYLLIPHYITNK